MSDFALKETYTYDDLLALVRLLRGPGGCPWDREQTHKSIRRNLLEEAYEVAEGIDADNPAMLREELGDYLFQAAFHIILEEERGRFVPSDVITDICRKMISRHPHIFGARGTLTAGEVPAMWEDVKRAEKHHATTAAAMHAVPRILPALMYAGKLENKAARAGFTYDTADEAAEKVKEEWGELQAATTQVEREEEYGDLLLALVNYGRMLGLDAEECLAHASRKFLDRFERTEAFLTENAGNVSKCTKNDWILAWKTTKRSE